MPRRCALGRVWTGRSATQAKPLAGGKRAPNARCDSQAVHPACLVGDHPIYGTMPRRRHARRADARSGRARSALTSSGFRLAPRSEAQVKPRRRARHGAVHCASLSSPTEGGSIVAPSPAHPTPPRGSRSARAPPQQPLVPRLAPVAKRAPSIAPALDERRDLLASTSSRHLRSPRAARSVRSL